MKIELTSQQKEAQSDFARFAREEIEPYADEYDRAEHVPDKLIRQLAQRKYLAGIVPSDWDGAGMDMITYGLLNEEIGHACSSVRSLITVHDMVAATILKWGTYKQRMSWLPRLTCGDAIGAFAASEPSVGSDIANVETVAVRSGDHYLLTGKKKWITFGQIADFFLVLAQCEGKPTTFLVERHTPGLWTKTISGMLGTRASMLAELEFDECPVPIENMLGRVGFGLLTAVSTGLGLGRYSVAWGCVGIAQACVDACVEYTNERRQFGLLLREHQLIQQLLADMITNVRAARLLCYQAGYLKDSNDPDEILNTFIAKYFASRAAMKIAADAVQIHGANGCGPNYSVQRYFRDAKIMEIIEGTNQIQQITIATHGQESYLAELSGRELIAARA